MPQRRLASFESLEARDMLSTNMIAELNPFGGHSDPNSIVVAGDRAFFSASVDGSRHLWVTDGTADGSRALTNLEMERHDPTFAIGDRILVWRDDGDAQEIWVSDGTPEGTSLLRRSEYSGELGYYVEGMAFEETLFWATSGVLWRSDGTAAGTHPVALSEDIWVSSVHAVDDRLLISTSQGMWSLADPNASPTLLGLNERLECAHQFGEQWLVCTDAEGTEDAVELFDPDTRERSDTTARMSSRDELLVVDDRFLVIRDTSVVISDGTSLGTHVWELGDIDSTALHGERLLVAVGLPDQGTALWQVPIDGAEPTQVTTLLADYVGNLTNAGGFTLFSHPSPDGKYEPWVTDGTAAGTHLLRAIDGGLLKSGSLMTDLTVLGNQILFSAATGTYGRELWITDGTAAGTRLVIDANPAADGSFPENWFQLDDDTFFFAKDGTDRFQYELWQTDGTASGTRPTGATVPGRHDVEDISIHDGLAYLLSGSFFITDGTPDGTRRMDEGVEGFRASSHAFVGDELLIAGSDSFELALFSYDTRSESLTRVDIDQNIGISQAKLFAFAGDVYVATERHSLDLWKLDVRTREFSHVQEIRPDQEVTDDHLDFIDDIVTVGDAFYFVADNGETGAEVWRSDGTPDGTALLRDLYEGEVSSYPRYLTEFQGELFFQGCGAEHGTELWRSDGTAEGTRLVSDIHVGPSGSSPGRLTVHGDELLFSANDGLTGYELWKTDGTDAGTSQVADIRPGEEGAYPWRFTEFQDKLFFHANDGVSGVEFWHYDSTAQRVAQAAETIPGPDYAFPTRMFATEQALFFRGYSDQHGAEPWVYRGDRVWFDPSFPADVDGTGVVSPLDALFVITELTLRNFSSAVDGAIRVTVPSPARADVNNDGFISPLDALLVINQLPNTATAAVTAASREPLLHFATREVDDVWARDDAELEYLF